MTLKQNADISSLKAVLEIGGGYGTLGEILLKANATSFYLNIDIPPLAAVSSYYLTKLFGSENVLTYEQTRDAQQLDIQDMAVNYRAAVICPWQLPSLTGVCDLFLNFISFQEMEPNVVNNYIDLILRHEPRFILLRNSRHGKVLATESQPIGVIDPVTTEAMIQRFTDFQMIGRDAQVFGDQSRTGGHFVSEVICLQR